MEAATAEPTLKRNAIGYISNVVIATASVAPAYSLAATLGFIVAIAGVGAHAPAVMIVSFIPMLLVAAAYRYLNKADPDPGTSFAWVARALNPHLGWMCGWAIVLADVIVMASLAQIAAIYTFLLVGWDSAADSTFAVIVASVIWIALMTYICYRGIELNARTQQVLLSLEVAVLALFAVVALVKVYANDPTGSVHPSLEWFNPFGLGVGSLVNGVLLGLFVYWGWDSGVAVNEESEDANNGPGKAAVLSTILLVLIYVVVTTASQAFHGPGFLSDNSDDVLNALGAPVLGGTLDKLLILCVLTSAAASTQTTILPTARTTLSMARKGAIPRTFARIHPRFQIPTTSTLAMGAVSIVWTVVILAFDKSGNVLADCFTALGFSICFYYGLTGFACPIFYRRQLRRDTRTLLLVGVAPFVGGLILLGIFIKALIFYWDPEQSSSGAIAGIGVPVVLGIGGLLLGAVIMLVSMPRFRAFFARRPELAPDGVI